jgi:hypothetical protein
MQGAAQVKRNDLLDEFRRVVDKQLDAIPTGSVDEDVEPRAARHQFGGAVRNRGDIGEIDGHEFDCQLLALRLAAYLGGLPRVDADDARALTSKLQGDRPTDARG